MSSIFNQIPKPSGSSIFGNPPSQVAASTAGATFGSFGSSTAPSQTNIGGGLFGQSLGAFKPNITGSSLPSVLGPTTNAAQPVDTGVSGSVCQQQKSESALGGPEAQRVHNGPSGRPYFDSILEKSRKRALDEDSLGIQLGLGDIRQRMKKIATEDKSADGRGHYLLAASGVDPGAAIRDLGVFTAHSTRMERDLAPEPADADIDGYLASLQTQTTMSMITDGLARSIRDFDEFIEDNVVMEWEAQRKRIYNHFGIKPREATTTNPRGVAVPASEWKGTFGRSRRDKGASAGGGASKGPAVSTFGRSSMQRSAIGAAGPVGQNNSPMFVDAKDTEKDGSITAPSARSKREKQAKYIEKVRALNASRLKGHGYPLLHELADVVHAAQDAHAPYLENCYKALIEMVGELEDPDSLKTVGNKMERSFTEAHLDGELSAPGKVELRKNITRGSASHLEKTFYREVELIVSKNPQEGRQGGTPDRISIVKAYIRIRASQKDLHPDNIDLQRLGDDYVWAVVFYLLRSGLVAEAARYVNENFTSFASIDRNFWSYISTYESSRYRVLPREMQLRVTNEYNQRLRVAPENSIDPFRMACYKVIGRCDLQNRNIDNINQQPDDFMWLQLRLAREIDQVSERAGNIFGLAEVQETTQGIFDRFANEPNTPGWNMSVYYQFLAGKFEYVVDYIYKHHQIEAVHLAIGLSYYGLLQVCHPYNHQTLLSYTTKEVPQINFGIMVGYYTRDFRAANVSAAVDYLCLLALNKDLPEPDGKVQKELCHEALRELVLESREFASILGDMRADGTRVNGILEERLPLIGITNGRDYVKNITLQAARIANNNGRTTDAVLLSHLAEEYNSVISIMNMALGNALANQDQVSLQPLKRPAPEVDLINQSRDQQDDGKSLTSVDDPEELARSMLRVYNSQAMYMTRISEEMYKACTTLLGMCEARRLFQQQQWPEVLDEIQKLGILPLNASGNDAEIRSKSFKFASLPEDIKKNVPSLLYWTIQSCENYKNVLLSTRFGGNEGTRGQLVEDLKRKNMDLTMYLGLLKYGIPGHVWEALVRGRYD